MGWSAESADYVESKACGRFRFRRSNIKKTKIKKRRGGQENE